MLGLNDLAAVVGAQLRSGALGDVRHATMLPPPSDDPAVRPTLLDPVPAHLVESLTTDTPPEIAPALEADTEQLCDYVLALSHLLTCQTPPGQMAKPLTGLMADLTSLLARKLLAPRWIRATNGSEFIEYK